MFTVTINYHNNSQIKSQRQINQTTRDIQGNGEISLQIDIAHAKWMSSSRSNQISTSKSKKNLSQMYSPNFGLIGPQILSDNRRKPNSSLL